MRGIKVALIYIGFFCMSALSADYIHDELGKNILYDGMIVSGNQSVPFTQSILVKTKHTLGDRTFDIVHFNVLRGKAFFEERTLYYSVKPDGIYLEATQDGTNPLILLDEPSLELPLPATVGQKFQRIRNENQGISTIAFEVVSTNEPYALGETACETIHLRGEGTFVFHADKTSKHLLKEIWYSKEGKLKQITIKDLDDTTKSTSEIHYVKTVDLDPTVDSSGNQPGDLELQSTDSLKKGQ